MASIANHKGMAIVVKPPVIGLDKDVRLLSHRSCQVQEGALQPRLAIAWGCLQGEHLTTVLPLHAAKTAM